MFPRQAVYKLLLRQGLINFARVGTAVHCLPSMFHCLLRLYCMYRCSLGFNMPCGYFNVLHQLRFATNKAKTEAIIQTTKAGMVLVP